MIGDAIAIGRNGEGGGVSPYDREKALELATVLRRWRQNSAHVAADQLRAAVAEIDRLTLECARRDDVGRALASSHTKLRSASSPTVDELLGRSVDELDLSVRASNVLVVAGIRTIGELTQRTEGQARRLKNSSVKVVREFKRELDALGLAFGRSPRSGAP